MIRKIKNIIFLLIGFILGILFLQTIYSYIYQGISEKNPSQSALYQQIYTFLDPNNLTIFLSILFFVGMLLVLLFKSYEYE
jgi:hypothetical protein